MVDHAKKRVTVQDDSGNAIANASVRVLRESDGGLATIYADRAGLDTNIGNPCYTDSDGMVEFYALGGAYKLVITAPGGTKTERYEAIGTAQEVDTSSFDTSTFQAVAKTVQVITATGTTLIADGTDVVIMNLASPGNATLTVSPIATRGNRSVAITHWNTNATVTFTPDAGDTGGVKGASSIDLVPGTTVEFIPSTSMNGWTF